MEASALGVSQWEQGAASFTVPHAKLDALPLLCSMGFSKEPLLFHCGPPAWEISSVKKQPSKKTQVILTCWFSSGSS